MSVTLIRPGDMTLDEWKAIYRGGPCALDPSALPLVARAAVAVDEIVARGEPVYGINTGFGKLAGVRIAAGDLATLQRNLVLSHAAGVGEALFRGRLVRPLALDQQLFAEFDEKLKAVGLLADGEIEQ